MLNRIIFLVSTCGLPFVSSAAEGLADTQGQANISSVELVKMQESKDKTREESLRVWQEQIDDLNSGVLKGQEAVDQIQKEVLKAWQAAEDQDCELVRITDSMVEGWNSANVLEEFQGRLDLAKQNRAQVGSSALREGLASCDEFFAKSSETYKSILELIPEYGQRFLLQEKVRKLSEILAESGKGQPEFTLSDSTLRVEGEIVEIAGRELMDTVRCAISEHVFMAENCKRVIEGSLDIIKQDQARLHKIVGEEFDVK